MSVVTDGPPKEPDGSEPSDQPERRDFGGPMSPPRPRERALNPAHAILGGAILSAIVTLVGVSLNIRSSERLSSERDKRDAAVAEANALKDKVGQLEQKLDEAVAKIPSSEPGSTVALTTVLAQPPQSIVVIVTIPTPPSSSGPPGAVTGATTAVVPTTRTVPTTARSTATTELPTSSTSTSTSSTSTSTTSSTTIL